MSDVFRQISDLSPLIHAPSRLAILTALRGCRSADFMLLMSLTGLTRGNLSAHLRKLETAKLVQISKRFVGRKPKTTIALTPGGRRAVDDHWKGLEELRVSASAWRPGTPSEQT